MPQFAVPAIAGAVGIASGTAGFAALSVAANVAFALGLSMVVQALQPSPSAPDRTQTLTGGIKPRKFHFGQTIAVPDIVYDDAVDRTRFQVCVHNHGEIPRNQIISFRFNGTERLVLGGGQIQPERRFRDNIFHEFNTGALNQSASRLMLAPSQIDGRSPAPRWTTAHRLNELAYSVVRSKTPKAEYFNQVYINGQPPLPSVEARFNEIYSYGNRDTRFSENPADIIAWFLTHPFGNRLPVQKIHVPSFEEAWRDFEELGYALAGFWRGNDEPKAPLANMLAAVDGALWIDNRGFIRLQAGKWVEPTVTITTDHIVAINSVTTGTEDGQTVSETVVRFDDRDQDYQTVEITAGRENTGEYAPNEINLSYIPFRAQAERVGFRAHRRTQARWRGDYVLNMAGLRLRNKRFFILHDPETGMSSEPMEIEKFSFTPADGLCRVTCRSVAESDFNPQPVEPLAPYQPLLSAIAA